VPSGWLAELGTRWCAVSSSWSNFEREALLCSPDVALVLETEAEPTHALRRTAGEGLLDRYGLAVWFPRHSTAFGQIGRDAAGNAASAASLPNCC
jgi:hypothetical protein